MINLKNGIIKYYSKNEMRNVVIPQWQRWTNPINVKELAGSLEACGILRYLLIAILPDGTKLLFDGNHIYQAQLIWGVAIGHYEKFIEVKEIQLANEKEAMDYFIRLNTTGKVLKPLDFIVSYASYGKPDYVLFMEDVLHNPKSWDDTKNIFDDAMFSMTALFKIFLNGRKPIKSGKATMIKNHLRIIELLRLIDREYRKDDRIKDLRKQRHYGINASSIDPIISEIIRTGLLDKNTNEEILDLIIEFTEYYCHVNENPSFQNGPVTASIKTFLKSGKEKAA